MVQTHQWIRVMGKKRKQPSEQSVFDDNPFLDGFFAWMNSPEGERAQEVSNTDGARSGRPEATRFVWPDAGPLDLSIEHIQKECPDLSVEEIEAPVILD